MGCDIHMYVERPGANGWEYVPPPPAWNSESLDMSGGAPEWSRDKWFWDRDYELFAWLANVRNYHDQPPLAEPRGMPRKPNGPSVEVARERKSWGVDGHSHTWFLLSELRSDFVVKHAGLIKEESYVEWKSSGDAFPKSWCQGSSAPHVSEADYIAGVRPKLREGLEWAGFYVACEWELPAAKSFERFFKFVRAVAEHAGADARLVFWFDN